MKIRNGFVSNSSSGSFIMHWRIKTFGKTVSIVNAIGRVFEVFFKDGTNGEEKDWDGTWNKEIKSKVEKAINATVQNADGSFTSTFWSGMVNSPEDFGDVAKSLVMGILASKEDDFEIIDAKTEMDY